MLRFCLTTAFILIPATVTFGAAEGGETALAQYGIPGALAAAMGMLGWVIRSALVRQIDSLDRLSRAVLIVATELTRRPCIAESERVKQLADSLLSGKRDDA